MLCWHHLRGSLWDRYLIRNEVGRIFYDDIDIWRVTQLPGSSEIGEVEVDTWPGWLTVYSTNWAAKYSYNCTRTWSELSAEQPRVTFKLTFLRAPWELGDPPNISIIVKYMSGRISDKIPVSKWPTQMIPSTTCGKQGFRNWTRVLTERPSYAIMFRCFDPMYLCSLRHPK